MRKQWKKWLSVCTLTAMLMLLAACGTDDANNTDVENGTTQEGINEGEMDDFVDDYDNAQDGVSNGDVNDNVNDVTSGQDDNGTIRDNTTGDNVVEELGEDVGQGIEDVGDGLGEGVEDLTGGGTNGNNGNNTTTNNR